MSAALSRRGALRGTLAASLGLAAGVIPVLASPAATNPDAALIEFAGRVAALERRCNVLSYRQARIEDRVMSILGFGPKAPPEPPSTSDRRWMSQHEMPTHRVYTIGQPLAEDPALAQWKAAHAAATAAYKRDREAMEARLGLPELEQRFNRMWARLHRWCAQLAEMQPQTLAGLAAKAEPLVAIGKTTSCGGSWGQVDEYVHSLAISLAHDAMRLGMGGVA